MTASPTARPGTMIVDDAQRTVKDPSRVGSGWHCAAEGNGNREGGGHELARVETTDRGTLYCTNFVVFPYLDDVHPGDGWVWARALPLPPPLACAAHC